MDYSKNFKTQFLDNLSEIGQCDLVAFLARLSLPGEAARRVVREETPLQLARRRRHLVETPRRALYR